MGSRDDQDQGAPGRCLGSFETLAAAHGDAGVDALRWALGDAFLLVDMTTTVHAEPKRKRHQTTHPAEIHGDLGCRKLFSLQGDTATAWKLRIGRAAENELVLPQAGVSRLHAYLRWDPAGHHLWLTDAGSRHGITLNRRVLEPGTSTELRGGQEIVFGQSVRSTFHTAKTLRQTLQLYRSFSPR